MHFVSNLHLSSARWQQEEFTRLMLMLMLEAAVIGIPMISH